MARRFTTNDVISLPVPAALQIDGGPITITALVSLVGNTYSCPLYTRTSGGTDAWWVEIDHATGPDNVHYGTGTTPRKVTTLVAADGWCVITARKANSGSATPYGRKLSGAGWTTDSGDVNAPSTLVDGSALDSTGTLQLGRWGVSGTNWSNMDLSAVYVWSSEVASPTPAGFTSHTAVLAASPNWYYVVGDATDSAGGSATITGTTSQPDPTGWFTTAAAAGQQPLVAPAPAVVRASTW